jgi:hypothetical protein
MPGLKVALIQGARLLVDRKCLRKFANAERLRHPARQCASMKTDVIQAAEDGYLIRSHLDRPLVLTINAWRLTTDVLGYLPSIRNWNVCNSP